MAHLDKSLESIADQREFLKTLQRDMESFIEEMAYDLQDDKDLARSLLRDKESLGEEFDSLHRKLTIAEQQDDTQESDINSEDENQAKRWAALPSRRYG